LVKKKGKRGKLWEGVLSRGEEMLKLALQKKEKKKSSK